MAAALRGAILASWLMLEATGAAQATEWIAKVALDDSGDSGTQLLDQLLANPSFEFKAFGGQVYLFADLSSPPTSQELEQLLGILSDFRRSEVVGQVEPERVENSPGFCIQYFCRAPEESAPCSVSTQLWQGLTGCDIPATLAPFSCATGREPVRRDGSLESELMDLATSPPPPEPTNCDAGDDENRERKRPFLVQWPVPADGGEGGITVLELSAREADRRLLENQLRAAHPLPAAFKLSSLTSPPEGHHELRSRNEKRVGEVELSLFSGPRPEEVLGQVAQKCGVAFPRVERGWCPSCDGTCEDKPCALSRLSGLTVAAAEALARCSFVESLHSPPQVALRSGTTSWVIQSNDEEKRSRPLFDAGIDGKGQVVGLIDDLVDIDHCLFQASPCAGRCSSVASPPVSATSLCSNCALEKFTVFKSSLGLPPGARASDHGTAVAGILAGHSSLVPDFIHNGQAPKSRIAFALLGDVLPRTGGPNKLPEYLDYLASSCGEEARIFSFSWGEDRERRYGALSSQLDEFLWENQDAVVVVAARNEHQRLSAYPPDARWQCELGPASPENAKNVLAVGASQQGGARAGRGSGALARTLDGRRKPEVYAPGCWIHTADGGTQCSVIAAPPVTSAHHPSREMPRGCAAQKTQPATLPNLPSPPNCATSWAAPAVAGAAALVRQYFVDGYFPYGESKPYPCKPTGALVKAMLLNGTVDMEEEQDQFRADASDGLLHRYPSLYEGWGRLKLDDSVSLEGDNRRTAILDVRHVNGLATGEEQPFEVSVREGCENLKFTLVWTEPPMGPYPSVTPVLNDLDLVVEEPARPPKSGTRYFCGNDFFVDSSHPRPSEGECVKDLRNNVEQVLIPYSPKGVYKIKVKAKRVLAGAPDSNKTPRQGFALVVSGALEGTWRPTSPDNCSSWPK